MTTNEQPQSECAVPFSVNRSLRVDVSQQVTDGLRLAIQSGFYASGSMVPTVREFARALGVSIRAPQTAFRTLTREGLLMPRRKFEFLDGDALGTLCGVENMVLHESLDKGLSQQYIVREAMEVFSRRYRRKADLPDAFIFADDYLARGALLALLSAGIRTGRDVLFITLANDGIVPIHPDPVDYVLRDIPSDAEAVAGTILRYLATGEPQETMQLPFRYIAAD